ncbi:hypothetical protein FGG08_001460 [Glutinoglossum americanum]|uniref:PH domain-like protein n=1 Tax=Glutinoglossum americanum TaxID=1670608 RepID=A0A9P8IGV3_9PEZI|nr:hypothetical protein FGG08_001460 [Glutinoglossum americanum]
MTPRNPKRRPNPQHSDYESDVVNFNNIEPPRPAAPSQTNDELNLSVLRRHNPAITSILSIAPYAVVYLFSTATQQWDKSGVEGTMFVTQLSPSTGSSGERYAVIILNRRGLDNFTAELLQGDDVDVASEYVILRVNAADEQEQRIYGLWIFSEPAPSSTAQTREINAQIIKDCAVAAETSRRLVAAAQKQQQSTNDKHGGTNQSHGGQSEDEQQAGFAAGSAPMGRQLSLRELFGQQRKQDSGWSVKNHSPNPQNGAFPPTGQFVITADTDFFRSGVGPPQQQRQAHSREQGVDLLELFRKAEQGR